MSSKLLKNFELYIFIKDYTQFQESVMAASKLYDNTIGDKLCSHYYRTGYTISHTPKIIVSLSIMYFQPIDYFVKTVGYEIKDNARLIKRQAIDESDWFSPRVITGKTFVSPSTDLDQMTASWTFKIINNKYLPHVYCDAIIGIVAMERDIDGSEVLEIKQDTVCSDFDFVAINQQCEQISCAGRGNTDYWDDLTVTPSGDSNNNIENNDIVKVAIKNITPASGNESQQLMAQVSIEINDILQFEQVINHKLKYKSFASFRFPGAEARMLSFNQF